MKTGKELAVCGLLLLAVVCTFGQSLRHAFVNYDDPKYVCQNPHVAGGLTAENIQWAFTARDASNWHPLTWLSHMLDCQLYGVPTTPGGHHLTSLLLHAATAIVLFLVLRQMTGVLWPSAFAAALFAVHPLRVESVVWIAERKDVLSGLFFMLTLAAYLGYVRRPSSWARYLAVIGLFALGLMAKPMLVTLPLVLLLLDYWPLGRMTPSWRLVVEKLPQRWGGSCTATPPHRRTDFQIRPPSNSRHTVDFPILNVGATAILCRCGSCTATPDAAEPPSLQQQPSLHWCIVIEKLPLLALSAASCAITLWAQSDAIALTDYVPFSLRLSNAAVSYVAYVVQFICPIGLAALYPLPLSALPLWKVAGAAFLLLAISTGVIACRRQSPHLLVGWLWYLGMLLPVIGLLQVGSQAMADRYTYLPQIGLCIAIAWGAAQVTRTWPYRGPLCGVAAALVLAILMGCAWRQTAYWHDSETLWRRALCCTEQNHIAHYNLGTALSDRGQVDEAIAEYLEALKIKPDYVAARFNLGVALAGLGRLDEAALAYRQVLEIEPEVADVHNNLGAVLAHQGRTDEAIAEYRVALKIEPDLASAHNNLGNVLANSGHIDEAIAEYRKALEIDPDYADARRNLGLALERRGTIP